LTDIQSHNSKLTANVEGSRIPSGDGLQQKRQTEQKFITKLEETQILNNPMSTQKPHTHITVVTYVHLYASIYVTDSLFAQPFSKSCNPPLHTPYISSANHCLLFATHAHTLTACFAVVSRLSSSLSLNSLLGTLIFYLKVTHSSDHSHLCLQCSDAVGWATGRASGLKKLSGGMLAWLSLWGKAQICIMQ